MLSLLLLPSTRGAWYAGSASFMTKMSAKPRGVEYAASAAGIGTRPESRPQTYSSPVGAAARLSAALAAALPVASGRSVMERTSPVNDVLMMTTFCGAAAEEAQKRGARFSSAAAAAVQRAVAAWGGSSYGARAEAAARAIWPPANSALPQTYTCSVSGEWVTPPNWKSAKG